MKAIETRQVRNPNRSRVDRVSVRLARRPARVARDSTSANVAGGP